MSRFLNLVYKKMISHTELSFYMHVSGIHTCNKSD
nr:MAG TPA: hypothetical protein [Caudoviricetes sp.]